MAPREHRYQDRPRGQDRGSRLRGRGARSALASAPRLPEADFGVGINKIFGALSFLPSEIRSAARDAVLPLPGRVTLPGTE